MQLSFSCNMLRLLCSHIALKFTNSTIPKINISDIILPNFQRRASFYLLITIPIKIIHRLHRLLVCVILFDKCNITKLSN